MGNVDLSVIIPSRNNKNSIAELIRRIAGDLEGRETEFIIIDMNSNDNSVIAALDELKRNNLRGCVIQSGGGNVSSALNTGIYKADGKYLTFVYPSRLYKNYISPYIITAEENNADFVYAVPSAEGEAAAQASEISDVVIRQQEGTELLSDLICSRIWFDFTAVLLRREFLLEQHVKFDEECNLGYAEAFIYSVLLHKPNIAFANMKLERDYENSSAREDASQNANCYGRIDAMVRIYESAVMLHPDHPELIELFEYRKLPSVVMSAIDLLNRENFRYSAIKKSLHQKGYDRLLKASRRTPPQLRKKILIWKTVPWLYKP